MSNTIFAKISRSKSNQHFDSKIAGKSYRNVFPRQFHERIVKRSKNKFNQGTFYLIGTKLHFVAPTTARFQLINYHNINTRVAAILSEPSCVELSVLARFFIDFLFEKVDWSWREVPKQCEKNGTYLNIVMVQYWVPKANFSFVMIYFSWGINIAIGQLLQVADTYRKYVKQPFSFLSWKNDCRLKNQLKNMNTECLYFINFGLDHWVWIFLPASVFL